MASSQMISLEIYRAVSFRRVVPSYFLDMIDATSFIEQGGECLREVNLVDLVLRLDVYEMRWVLFDRHNLRDVCWIHSKSLKYYNKDKERWIQFIHCFDESLSKRWLC